MCVLSYEVIQSILEDLSISNRSLCDHDLNSNVEILSILLYIGDNELSYQNKDLICWEPDEHNQPKDQQTFCVTKSITHNKWSKY